MSYDRSNIFAKILRREIPATLVYEDDHAIAFPDIAPNAPTHVLVLPKGEYTDYTDFTTRADERAIAGFFKAVRIVAQQLGVEADFRLITNNGAGAGQSVFHFHVHLLAGKTMHRLLADE